ncbi:MAG: DUF6438 domain-containing protein [Flavobacteriales bacterium]
MKYLSFVFFALLVVVAGACKSKSTTETTPQRIDPIAIEPIDEMPKRPSVFFEMKRTACFGTCPIYNVTIMDNGEVYYEGKNFVEKIGNYHTTLDNANLQKIRDKIVAINYFSLQDEYDSPITDIPSVYTTVNYGGQTKTIHDRHKGPRELDELYALVDDILNACNWSKN